MPHLSWLENRRQNHGVYRRRRGIAHILLDVSTREIEKAGPPGPRAAPKLPLVSNYTNRRSRLPHHYESILSPADRAWESTPNRRRRDHLRADRSMDDGLHTSRVRARTRGKPNQTGDASG